MKSNNIKTCFNWTFPHKYHYAQTVCLAAPTKGKTPEPSLTIVCSLVLEHRLPLQRWRKLVFPKHSQFCHFYVHLVTSPFPSMSLCVLWTQRYCKWKFHLLVGVSVVAQQVKNLTSIH